MSRLRAAHEANLRARGVPKKSGAQSGQGIDSQTTNVFTRGADGKLHPIPGWTTTGPFDIGTWLGNVNWGGVTRDLATVGAGALAGGASGLASRAGVLGVTGEGLSVADRLSLGGRLYLGGDTYLSGAAPKERPKHW